MNRPIAVLLVDDDEMVSTCISAWLEDEGFTVHTASSGTETLELLASTPVDVALVDLNLQGMTGEDLISQASASYPGIQFLIHTGQHFYQLSARLLALGLREQHVVYKPIAEMATFCNTLRQLVFPANGDLAATL